MSHEQHLSSKSISSGIEYLWSLVQSVSQDPLSEKSREFFHDLPDILFIILGGDNKKGWLTQSFEDLHNPSRFSTCKQSILIVLQSPDENLRQLVQLLSPPIIKNRSNEVQKEQTNIYSLLFESELIEGQRYSLSTNVLPDHITDLRRNGVWKHPSLSRFSNLLDVEITSGTERYMVLSPCDWFLFAFAYNLKTFRPTLSSSASRSSDLRVDPYLKALTTNPFLLLLRRYLEYFDFLAHTSLMTPRQNEKKQLFKKFSFILEETLIGETIHNLDPCNLEPLLHYSILDGLQLSMHPQSAQSVSSSQMGDSKHHQYNFSNSNISNDVIDHLSGYSKQNILSNYLGIKNMTLSKTKNKDSSFQKQHSSYIFQALLVLLHFKRRHFKILTLQLFRQSTSSTLRQSSNLQTGSTISNGQFGFGQRMSQSQLSSSIYSRSQLRNGNQTGMNSSQLRRDQYIEYREMEGTCFTQEQFPLEYFRDHGEDNHISVFFKKLSLFLKASFDDWRKDSPQFSSSLSSLFSSSSTSSGSKFSHDTLYDQGRLLVNLIGHFKYFEFSSCEDNLFEQLKNIDEEGIRLPSDLFLSKKTPSNLQDQPSIVSVPRPHQLSFSMSENDIQALVPTSTFGRSSFRDQIAQLTDEVTQIRFKMVACSTTLLTNKYLQIFSQVKEVTACELSILLLLLDVLISSPNDLITRLNQLDTIILKHACEFFLLGDRSRNTDVDIKIFDSLESLDMIRSIGNSLGIYVKKHSPKQQQFDDSDCEEISNDEGNPIKICKAVKRRITFFERVHSQTNSGGLNGNNYKKGRMNQSGLDWSKDDSSANNGGNQSTYIENKRISYDFNSWQAPIASFENKILFELAIQVATFIDFVRNGFTPTPPNTLTAKRRFPKTNLRKFANVYFAFSVFVIAIFLVYLLNFIFTENTTTPRMTSRSHQRTYPQNNQPKYDWNLGD